MAGGVRRSLLRPVVAVAVAITAVLLSGAVIGVVGEAERTPSPTDTLPDGDDSTEVAALADDFGSSDGSLAVVLFTAEQGALSDRTVQEELAPISSRSSWRWPSSSSWHWAWTTTSS